jgi:hypothetical protein
MAGCGRACGHDGCCDALLSAFVAAPLQINESSQKCVHLGARNGTWIAEQRRNRYYNCTIGGRWCRSEGRLAALRIKPSKCPPQAGRAKLSSVIFLLAWRARHRQRAAKAAPAHGARSIRSYCKHCNIRVVPTRGQCVAPSTGIMRLDSS